MSVHHTQAIIEVFRSQDDKGSALASLTTHLVGNETRKADSIRHGLLPLLESVLKTQDGLYLPISNVLTILAFEGPHSTGPILQTALISLLLRRLSLTSPPLEKIAILKCLNTIALNLPSKELGQWAQDTRLADLVLERDTVVSLVQLVKRALSSLTSQQICDYTLALFCKVCTTETQKRIVIEAGLLDVLCSRFASFVVSEGLIAPSLETLDFPSTTASSLPGPALPYAHISPTLETISLLIENSKERIEQFVNHPSVTTVLPQPRNDFSPTDTRQGPWGHSLVSVNLNRPRFRNAFDALLPTFPLREKTNTPNHLNFPPLGAAGPGPRRRPSFQPSSNFNSTLNIIPENEDAKLEKTVVPFLLLLARESKGKRRFLACKLLVILATHHSTSTSRLRSYAGLLVPILIRMIDMDDLASLGSGACTNTCLCDGSLYKKSVPTVLAELLRDEPELQKAAVEAKAIPKLSAGLRSTFSSPVRQRSRLWRPFKEGDMDMQDSSSACILSHGGPTRELRQAMAYREGTLRALAAIAPFDDSYRKQVCDQGILTEIMLAMEPFSVAPNDPSTDLLSGNSTSTILAACGAVRALTRSVTALRTKLVDAEVAKTVIKLMGSTDLEVRIAATKVLTNLAMDFSPLKESVGDSAVVKKLCEQAHSANARLRLESIWALKQLVVNAPKKLKQEVVNELGCSWIKLLIRTDPFDIPKGEVIGLVDKDYPPNAMYEQPEDIVMSEGSDGEDSLAYADANSELVHSTEDEYSKHTPEDDLAIQEQVLDLIRNIFVTSTLNEPAAEIVDYVLQEMGIDEFFQILKARMSPRTMYGPTRKGNHVNPPPAGVVTRVLYIVLHIAACSQKWRIAIASEQDLLKRILGFSSHAEREVRANCCWLAINLMFEDEVSDRNSCRRRATELSRLGYRMQLQKLENDPDLDVRERAKTAMTLFSTLLDQR